MERKDLLRNSLKPLILTSRICGVFPLQLKNSQNKTYSVSKVGIIHGIANILLMVYIFRHIFEHPHASSYSQFFVMVSTTSLPLLTIIIAISFICRAKLFCRAINDVFNYSVMIKSNTFFVNVSRFLIIIFVINEIILLQNGGLNVIKNFSDFIQLFTFIIYHIYQNLVICLNFWFFVIMKILRETFKEINNEIGDVDRMLSKKYNLLFELGISSRRNQFGRVNNEEGEILWITDLYRRVCDTCGVVNKCFGIPSAAHTVYVMIYLSVGVYDMMENQESGPILYLWIYLIVLFAFLEYLVLFSCQRLVKEVSYRK